MKPHPILPTDPADRAPSPLDTTVAQAIAQAGGWLGFDDFMALALYAPGLGYYASDLRKFGLMPGGHTDGGSDFVTAPEMSPYFGRALARQVGQALDATGTTEVWEFGAGSGALADHLLQALGSRVTRYTIVDLSGSLVARQKARLAAHGDVVQWATSLPAAMRGVVVGNEVLDAMPVKLLARVNGAWHERGVVVAPTLLTASDALPPDGVAMSLGAARREAQHDRRLLYADQPTPLRPPFDVPGAHDYLTEIHPQGEGFVRTLADHLVQGAIFLIDYGFPEHEYYHPQRTMGTVMCHQGHRVDADALAQVGRKDITAHVNFTGIALAAQDAGLQVLGYTSQGRFLLNCGIVDGAEQATLAERAMLQKLINEHEMGELFKVIGFAANGTDISEWSPLGFATGDRTHTL